MSQPVKAPFGCLGQRKQSQPVSSKLALMSYNRGGLTPMPGMELGMPAQPIYPGVRIGGSDMPGAFTLQVVHPNGQTINVEIGDLSRPLSAASSHGTYVASASGPIREGLSRPSSDHMRRRASSVASSSGMEYDPFNGGGHNHGFHQGNPLSPHYRSNYPHHKQPLIDRVGAMNLNERMSNNSSPMPDLTRSDPSTSFSSGRGEFGGDNFSRPNSRTSNRSYNQPPYARPKSSNSSRSNGSFQSHGLRPRRRDGFYPKYNTNSKTNVGSYPVLPVERRRPFFTPVPEDPVAAILVKNIASDCTLADINTTFADFGRIKLVEVIERCPPTMTVYIEYESKDDADMAIQQTNGVFADKFLLDTTHVDPKIVHRPHKTSNDPAFRLSPKNGLTTSNPARAAAAANVADREGGKTSLASMFASKSPTPHPAHGSSSSSGTGTGRDDVPATGNGWDDPAPPAKKTAGTGWEGNEPANSSTNSDDGWGMPASKTAEDGNGWRVPSVREQSSDIDLV